MMRIQLSDLELVNKIQSLSGQMKGDVTEVGDDNEIQDVVNSKDEIVGSLPRGVIWDNGIQGQTRVVDIFVVDAEGKVLLPVRSAKKRYLPGGYDFSCGENLRAGEDYDEAAWRGLKEELGLVAENLKEIERFVPDHDKGLYCFGKVFLMEVGDKSEVIKFNTDEIDRLEWRSKNEILEMLLAEPEKFKDDYETLFKMVFGSGTDEN